METCKQMSDIRTIALVVYIVTAIIVLFLLIVNNRRAEALWKTVFPSAVIGLVAFLFTIWLKQDEGVLLKPAGIALAAGLTGAIFTIWWSLEAEPVSKEFWSEVIFHKTTKEPLITPKNEKHPWFTDKQFSPTVGNIISRKILNGRFRGNACEEDTVDFYLDSLFAKMIEHFLWLYADTWNVDVIEFPGIDHSGRLVHFRDKNVGMSSISCDDLQLQVKKRENLSEFLSGLKNFCEGKINVPQGTKERLEITKNKLMLTLDNDFVKVRINMQYVGGGTNSEYIRLLGYNDAQANNYWGLLYRIRLKADFKKRRAGHGMMPDIRHWVETMFCEIEDKFDTQKRLERERQLYLLYGK